MFHYSKIPRIKVLHCKENPITQTSQMSLALILIDTWGVWVDIVVIVKKITS